MPFSSKCIAMTVSFIYPFCAFRVSAAKYFCAEYFKTYNTSISCMGENELKCVKLHVEYSVYSMHKLL